MADVFPPADVPTDTAAEVADLIGGAARRIRVLANRDLAPRGVTWAQLRALRTCGRADGPLRMSELAERLGIARRSATSVVDELEAKGLVARQHEPRDRRAVAVVVTPAGRELLGELRARRRGAAAELTAGLSAAELVALRDLLRRLEQAAARLGRDPPWE